jgi:HEAT repeat protein
MVRTRASNIALLIALSVFGSREAHALPQEDPPTTELREPALMTDAPCPQSLDLLLAFLKSDEPWTRKAAADCLGDTKDGRAVEPLVHAIFVENVPRIVVSERSALRKINDSRTADLLLEALNFKETRWVAAYSLGDLQIRRGTEPLLALLKSGDQQDRRTAADALGYMKDIGALDALCAALKQDDEVLRRYAASSLGKIGDRRAVNLLLAALDDPDDGVRWNAANSLGKISDPSAVTPLALRFADADEDQNVRQAAAQSLGEIADPAAVATLIEGLKSDSRFQQWYSAKALASIQQPEAVQALEETLEERNLNVAAALYPTLIHTGDGQFVPLLIEALNTSGDRSMAQDFLNSENSQLADAARKYASERGFEISNDSD